MLKPNKMPEDNSSNEPQDGDVVEGEVVEEDE